LVLASAQRADLLVDFSDLQPGSELTFVNTARVPFNGAPFPAELASDAADLDGLLPYPEVMRFRVVPGSSVRRTAPEQLTTDIAPPSAQELAGAVRRSIALVEQELEGVPNMLTMRELAPAPDGDATQPLITVIDRDADTGAETSDDLFHPDSDEFDASAHAAGEAAFWNHLAPEWGRYVEIAMTAAPRLPVLDDGDAQAIRERIEELLGAEEPTPLPEPAAGVAGQLAADVTDTLVDWNVALDALIMGYRCRQAEVERGDWTSFDPEYTARLKEMSVDDPGMAVAAGAVNIDDGLPTAFGPSNETWTAVCGWAVAEALDRSWERHRLKMEDGDGPALSRSEVEHALLHDRP
jgi:hypothetical protein